MLNIFITGTDSNVGKTFVTAGLAATMQSLGYSTCVYKPVQTGAVEKSGFAQAPDLVFVKTIDPYIKTHCSYFLKEQSLPVISAENENVFIDGNFIKKESQNVLKDVDCMIAEGTGGMMTPLAQNFLVSDMARVLDLPVIVVINPEISTVNQTLLTINHAVSKGLTVRGVIINKFPEMVDSIDIKATPRLIEEYTDAKVLGVIKDFHDVKKINPSDFITNILNGVDIESVFDVKISKLNID